jgi:hypothetical protein
MKSFAVPSKQKKRPLIGKMTVDAKKKVKHLTRLLETSSQIRVAWMQELAHVEHTGRDDWVDPNPIRVRPADHVMKPPPAQPRG